MAKIVDITEKLDFEQKPQIKIKGDTLTVNNEAVTVLEIMPLFEKEETSSEELLRTCKLLFSENDFEKIKALKLNVKDFKTLFEITMSLVSGDSEGETATPATT